MSVSLAKLLFLEKRSQAMGLMQQLENGFILTKDGQQLQLSQLSPDQFMRWFWFEAAVDMPPVERAGHFSTVMIDFGVGDVECVIKFGHRIAAEPGGYVPKADEDSFWDFAAAAKKYGGQSFATPLPNIYYLNTLRLADSFQLPVCIMEFVEVEMQTRLDIRPIRNMIKEAMRAVAHGTVESFKEGMAADGAGNLHQILEECAWSLDDLLAFAKVLIEVTGGKARIDVHEENVGRRSDGSLCVFDPVAFKN